MKRYLNLFGFLVSGAFIFMQSLPVFAMDGVAVISNLEGTGQILRGGQVLPAQTGMACQKNDVLKTGGDCRLDFSMNGLAGCRILASSECAIQNADAGSMHLKVGSGNVVLNLKKLPAGAEFKVETPTAVASVRGTQFWGRVEGAAGENPITTFAVRDGSVIVTPKGPWKTFVLEKGQALDIPKDPAVIPVLRPALEEELNAMRQADAIQTSA